MSSIPFEFERYRILNEIGSGQFGTVYKALDRGLNQIKAIKILEEIEDPLDFKKKLEEAHALGKFKGHKHIVQINSADLVLVNGNERLIIDMEYISGGSLESLSKSGQLSFKSSVQYVTHVLHALEYIHRSKMLHQDVKPANILIDGNIAKLSDFGLASLLGDRSTGYAQYWYVSHSAPETITDRVVSNQTDIFATGITLYRVICHYYEWAAIIQGLPDFSDIAAEGRIVEEIGFPSFVSPKIKKIIRKSCKANARQRYQTASEMISALSQLRFNIDWTMNSPDAWTGLDSYNNRYDIKIQNNGRYYHVDVMKNRRRISNLCKRFSESDAALEYLNKHVSNTVLINN